MSYRTYINDTQIFGNHECYEEWLDFIRSQGIEVGEDDSYDGEITDFMKALDVVEKITLRLANERHLYNEKCAKDGYAGLSELFDWSDVPRKIAMENKNDRFHTSLFDKLYEIVHNGYAFLPYALYLACENKLEKNDIFAVNGHLECFKVKDGETIRVYAR